MERLRGGLREAAGSALGRVGRALGWLEGKDKWAEEIALHSRSRGEEEREGLKQLLEAVLDDVVSVRPWERVGLVNPVAEPDLARLEAFLIPGVVCGHVTWETPEGTWVTDFDNRDALGNPTRTFIPKTG